MCVATFNGVPYPSMNNAAKVNVGLDIINVLSDHYGFTAPIFIDNKESVSHLIEVKSQVICLTVSKRHKELTVCLNENDHKGENAA
jgi:hypothetical protein